MKNVQRKRCEALKSRYKPFWTGNICYYCGDLADTKDHCPAISLVYSMGAERFSKKDIPLVTVTCCRECNSTLGDRMHLTLETRGRFLYQHYLKKYHKILYGKQWTEEELDEFDYSLREYIQTASDIQGWIERRLSFMEEVLGIAA